jgi:hypothetical protein
MTNKGKNSVQDSILLWLSAIVATLLLLGGLSLAKSGGLGAIWGLYGFVNIGVICLLGVRIRNDFKYGNIRLLFIAWVVAHLVGYAAMTLSGVPPIIWVFSIPVEVGVIKALLNERVKTIKSEAH